MAAKIDSTICRALVINRIGWGSGDSRTNLALNAAYVHGTSGPAVAVRYICPTADPIDELYIFLDDVGGTLGSVTMECKIYNEHASTVTQPGSTERDASTATAMPNAVDKWIKFTFGSPYTPTVGEILWLVCYNTAAAPATDFPNILYITNTNPTFEQAARSRMQGFRTTNGFSSAGTSNDEMPFVVKQGSNYFGQPFTQRNGAFYTSNTRKRGIVVDGVTEDVKISGICFSTGNANWSGIEIFTSNQAPGDTPVHSFALGTDANESRDEICGCKTFDTPVTLTGGTDYRVVLTLGAALQTPELGQIEDYSSYPTIFDALFDGMGLCYSTIDNGSNGWTDEKNVCPAIALHISEFVEQAAGNAGASYSVSYPVTAHAIS